MKKFSFKQHFKNKKVIVTGHTGFKGSWLTLWLISLGAKVIGVSNEIKSSPSNFEILNLKKKIINYNLDIRNFVNLKKVFLKHKPDFVFHLAAQAIVKKSYSDPLNTFTSNTIGTINLLESLKYLKNKCIAIIITSDKSYKNLEIKRGYKEDDLLGGTDPYSASKGCAELAIQSYIKSFYLKKKNYLKVGIARAGNVIGGGDWSDNRIIPDCIKAWSRNRTVIIRNPNSTRPWQHVLEVINGYLTFAINLKYNSKINYETFNFGPKKHQDRSVISLINEIKKNWDEAKYKIKKEKNNLESQLLKLNSNKAKKILNWSCKLNFVESVELTAKWYRTYFNNRDMLDYSIKQIKNFESKKCK